MLTSKVLAVSPDLVKVRIEMALRFAKERLAAQRLIDGSPFFRRQAENDVKHWETALKRMSEAQRLAS